MGFDYAFMLISPAAKYGELLGELANRLCRSDRERLLTALPGHMAAIKMQPAGAQADTSYGIAGLGLGEYEHVNDYCFSFLFAPDAELYAYEQRSSRLSREDNCIPIGCIWTKLQSSRRFVQLQATAATTDMSLLFAQSASIQESWSKLAAATGSYALFLDTEDAQTWTLLYPEQRRVARPELEAHFQGDGHVIDTDSHCLTALRLAGLPPPAESTGG